MFSTRVILCHHSRIADIRQRRQKLKDEQNDANLRVCLLPLQLFQGPCLAIAVPVLVIVALILHIRRNTIGIPQHFSLLPTSLVHFTVMMINDLVIFNWW
jgi:hypothetical protein